MTYLLETEEESTRFGAALGTHLKGGDAVFLSGELGSGKSVIARGIARSLGVGGAMPSPTFTLAIPYDGNPGVCHMDLYRLEDPDEFADAGLYEYLSDDFVTLIEWPFPEISAKARVEITLRQSGGARQARLALYDMDGRAPGIREALSNWEDDT